MLTYNSLVALDPAFREGAPEELARFIYDQHYRDRYDFDQFREAFLSNRGVPTADDLGLIDPSFKEGDRRELFDFVKPTLFGDNLDPDQEDALRAQFLGEAEERTWAEAGTDLLKGYASGANRMLAGAAWLAGRPLPEGFGEETADKLSDTLRGYAEDWESQKSTGLRQEQALAEQAREERKLEGQGLLRRGVGAAGDYLTNPALLADTTAASLPYLVPGGLAARGGAAIGAARAAGVAGATAETIGAGAATGAAAGTIVFNGVLEGSDAALTAQDEVRQMGSTPEGLQRLYNESEEFRALVDDKVDPSIAVEMVALSASRRAFAITAPIAGLATKLTAGMESAILRGGRSPTSLLSAAVKEPAEEFIQESSNQLGVNVGVGTTADPSRRYLDNVIEAGGIGAVAGLTQAAGFKGVEYAQDALEGRLPDRRAARDIIGRARDGEALTEDEIKFARKMYPVLGEDFFADSREARDELDLLNPEQALKTVEDDKTFIEPGLLARPQDYTTADEDALAKLEKAAAGRTVEEDPLAKAAAQRRQGALTNIDVYDRIMRAAEQTEQLLPEEEAFIARLKAGELKPLDIFVGGEIDREAPAELISGAIWRGLQPPATPTIAPSAPVENVSAGGIIIPEGARTATPLPAAPPPPTFKTKKEADLAATQKKDAKWESFKIGDKKWGIRAASEKPVASAVPTETPGAPAAGDLLGAAPAAAAPEPVAAGAPVTLDDLQNRDRTRAESVNQMQLIAKAPDYDRVGIGAGSDEAAPLVSQKGDVATIPDEQKGESQTVVFADGSKMEAQYAVVEADSVKASHFADGRVNPDYAQTKDGDLIALSNGRTAGLQEAYRRGNAADYRAKLLADTRHGVAPAVIEKMKAPVLVRVYSDADNRSGLAALSNARPNMAQSASEKARNDGRVLDIDALHPSDEGTLQGEANRTFASKFLGSLPKTEHNELLTDKGDFAPAFWARLQAALFARVYGDPDLIVLMTESQNPGIAAVLSALNIAARDMAQLDGAGKYDIRPTVVAAAQVLRQARNQRTTVDGLMSQYDMLGAPDPAVVDLARQMESFKRSSRKLGESLKAAAIRAARSFKYESGGDMFGGTPEDVAAILKDIRPEGAVEELPDTPPALAEAAPRETAPSESAKPEPGATSTAPAPESPAPSPAPVQAAAPTTLPLLQWARRKATDSDVTRLLGGLDHWGKQRREFYTNDPIYEAGGLLIVSRLWNHNSSERWFDIYDGDKYVETHDTLAEAKAAAEKIAAAKPAAEPATTAEATPAGETGRFQYAAAEAKTEVELKTIWEKVTFHAFNPNGLVAQKYAIDAIITKAINEGKLKSGWSLAHGTLDRATDEFAKLASASRSVTRIGLTAAKDRLGRAIDRAKAALEKEGLMPSREKPESALLPNWEAEQQRLREKLAGMPRATLIGLARDADLSVQGGSEEIIERIITAREAIETLKNFKYESEVAAAVEKGLLSKEKLGEWARLIAPRQAKSIGDMQFVTNISRVAGWGRRVKAFKVEQYTPEERVAYEARERASAAASAAEAKVALDRDAKAKQILESYRQDIADWWAKLSPGERLDALKAYMLEDLSDKSTGRRAAILAESDPFALPSRIFHPTIIAEAILDNPALREQIGVPEDVTGTGKYGGYSPAELGRISVDVPVQIVETGETRTVQQNARQALDEIDADIKRCSALLRCLGAT